MEKSVMLSVKPCYCAEIANGEKTLEIRKTRPKLKPPFKVYIYCTNRGRPLVYGDVPAYYGWAEQYTQTYGRSRKKAEEIWTVMNGKVIGEFICDRIDRHHLPYPAYQSELSADLQKESCMDYWDLHRYVHSGDPFFTWHISNLVIYDDPKDIGRFCNSKFGEAMEQYFECHERFGEVFNVIEPDHNLYALKRPPQNWCYCY